MHLKKSMLLCSLLFAVHLGTFAQTPQDAYTVKYDGNGATSGEMDDHTFAIGVEETTNLDPNSFVRSYNISFDTQGGDSIADMKADYTFQGWIHEQLLTEITQNMENNWFNISTEAGYDDIDLKLITLSTTDGVTSVSINPKGKTRERLYSQPIFMPAGDYELSFKVCSPTGYQDLTSEWEMRFKCSACDQPQTIYCNDLGLLTKGEEKSAAIIEYYEASNELVERKFTIFANDTTPVYIAINGGNIRDNVRSDFKFADFVLSKDGATSLKYTDKEPTRNIVRENGGVVELKAQWKEASIKLPTPTKEGYTFTFWNTKPDGKGKSYKGGASLKITADTKLYAMWEKGGGSGEDGCPSLNQTTQGKDFWVAFIKNNSDATAMIEYPYGMQVTLASNKACEVTLQNIPIGFSQTVSLGEKESKTIDIPYDDFAIDIEQSQIINKSLQITSTEEISVFTSSYEYHSMDASIVLPTSSWGTEYVVQTYDSWGGSEWTNYQYKPAQVMIIAAEDNTIVEILPSVNIKDHNAKEAFTVELNEGEVYYMKAEDATSLRGFSGTTIVSKNGQNISVIAGNQCAMVPLGSTADVDMLMETMYPVSSWGNRFCFIPSKNGYADILKYTAAGKGAIIYRNGKQIAKLGAYESFEESLRESEGVSFITSSEPIEIFQYMTSNRYLATRTKGGPSMVYLNPIEQGISETVFSTYNFDNEVSEHWMNLLVKSSDVNDITLDGESEFTTFTKVTGNDQYSYATVSLKDGFHSLKSPNAFIATIYGLGNDISYAYSAGSNLYSINDPETITDTICEGFQYIFGGRKYTETGVYLDTITNESGCEEIKILNLTVATPSDTTFLKDSISKGSIYKKYGFNITETTELESKYHFLNLLNKFGCDSIVSLNLTVKEKPSEDPNPSVPGTYTVVYDGNGATSGKMDKHVYTIGANETTQLDANQYKKVYNVTFDTQGGSSVDNMQSSCEFAGWLQEIDESSAIYNDMANTTELVREENGIVTIKAQWKDKSIVTPFAPGKAGYTFKEWNTKADGTGDSYAAYVEVEISSDTKFYAIWVPEEELEIPTAFTPHSNDGMNDIFMEGYEVYIYDRYGDVITHSNNGWDGTYKGKTATPGVYVYVLIDKKGNSERTIKGTIEIVKAK